MKKVIKKTLVMILVSTLIVTSVTHYERQEVKGAVTISLTTAEIIALILGGGAVAGLTLSRKGVTEENFKVSWNDLLRTVQSPGMGATIEILKETTKYCGQAWSAYEQEGLPWDLPVGGIEGNPTRREIWSETWDTNPLDFELFRQTVNNNNPTEPPENDSGKFVLKLLAGTLGFSALVGASGYFGEDIITFLEGTEAPETIINPNTGEIVTRDGDFTCNEYTVGMEKKYRLLSTLPDLTYQYKHETYVKKQVKDINVTGTDIYGYYNQEGDKVFFYSLEDKPFILGLNETKIKDMRIPEDGWFISSYTEFNLGAMLNKVVIDNCFTNIPIFSYENGVKYRNGEVGIEVAENYTEPTIEQKKLQEIINGFNELLDKMENEGIDKPYDNIQQAMQDYIQDIVSDIQEQITPDTTPEDVVDDIKDRLIDDIDTTLPVSKPIPPIPPIDEPTNPNPPVPPSDDVTLGGVLSTAFPFCIPFDLIYLIKALKATPEPPRWVFPIDISKLNIHEEIVIDFAQFETVAEVCRICFTILFIFGLIMATRKLIKG